MKTLIVLLLTIMTIGLSSAEERPLHIGLILPLTGPGAVWGQHLRQGAELATSGNSKVTLTFEDDHLDAAAAVSAYHKLRSSDQINAVIVFGAQSARAIVPLAERDKVLALIVTTDSRSVAGTRFAVRLALDALPQATKLINYLKDHGFQKTALVGTTQEAMLEYLSSFESTASSNELTVVFKEDYSKGETDFRTQLDRILATKPDVVVSSLLPPSFSAFAKQLRQRDSKIKLFGFAQSENLAEIKAAEGALDNLIFSSVVLTPSFVEEYKTYFGEYPQSYACYTFDLVKMLTALNMEKVEDTAKRLRDLKDYSGACGAYSAKSDFGFALSAKLVVIKDGHFRDLETKG